MKISKANAEHYLWGGDCDGWHLVKSGGLSVIHERMPAGRAEQRHYHEQSRQCFFVLQGELTMALNGERVTLSPGEAIEIPPLAPHQARNDGLNAVEFLVISQPTTRGDRVNLTASPNA
ncbi:cupin domain-containing protein [Cronobacter dublinensis]|uniref:cupin domain-containing protein n=1 Tax=Cronobacter dublinensis TaxID=413497 RepID=UPI000CFAC814|nr:cupin domain-containing protein [Cronobacter dublinensis]EKF2277518.1 cupin domain-containing protein [Cronobacter dublinensis]EKF2292442.1 cupin domain-containing protein [Cronobacter dublinensis]EKF2294915.1 cupin domain-containing protein [Cronobacter dublinensis]EKK5268593.1 cupin domain-containing protein [Cronobacter dublinensis]EKM0135731.1 cupin domain-containing protein [Cronobacter dublinensis]